MSQILVRDVAEQTLLKLKQRARNHGHSMQKEVKMLLEWAVQSPWPDETGTVFPPVATARVKGIPASQLLLQDRR